MAAEPAPEAHMRQASLSDVEELVVLMREFYAESDYPLDEQRAGQAFREFLSDERLGRAWFMQQDGVDAGYIVVTLRYSMEYGGFDAFIDDLFIRPAFRNAGLGSLAVAAARAFCLARGVRAIHLEAEPGNNAAQRIYRKAGFESSDRQLLTLRLKP